MAKNSALRIKPTNNNIKRKRLKIHTTKEDRLRERAMVSRKRDRIFRRNLALLTIFSLFAMAALLINAKIQLKRTKIEYNKLDSQYISYELTRDRLKTKLEKTIDIKEIQRYAMEELGMVYANDENTVHVNVNR